MTSIQQLALCLGVAFLGAAALGAGGTAQRDMVVERYDAASVAINTVVHIYLGDLFSAEYLTSERSRMESLLKNPSGLLDARGGDIRNNSEFKCRLWVNSSMLFDGVIDANNALGVADHFAVITKERFLFIEVLFPEDGKRFRGIVDVKKGHYLRFSKGERIEFLQSTKEFKLR